MKVSATRCEQSMNLPPTVNWFCEGRLRTSDAYPGMFWGTCLVCGKPHYDVPFADTLYRRVLAARFTDDVYNSIVVQARKEGVTESVVIRRMVEEKLKVKM